MLRALELARRAEGCTRPNPLVGCVIVRDGRVIGEGFHARAGQPHAEREALASCTNDSRGSTMYVTLEPCAHHGRTPPCADAVIDAEVARVVVAQRDPNPEARGGIERLREAGVTVDTGTCKREALLLNPGFNTYHMLCRPLITLKWAISADGCTSCASGDSGWISNPSSRRVVHELRAASDGVLVGIETAVQDQARLTIREAEISPGPPLRRIVLDSTLRIAPTHPLVETDPATAVICCTEKASLEKKKKLTDAGATVLRIEQDEQGRVSIPALMTVLHAEGIQSLLVEGGRRLAGSFLAAGMVDRIEVFVAPLLIGSGKEPLSSIVHPDPISRMDQALRLHHSGVNVVEGDVHMHGWLTKHLFPD